MPHHILRRFDLVLADKADDTLMLFEHRRLFTKVRREQNCAWLFVAAIVKPEGKTDNAEDCIYKLLNIVSAVFVSPNGVLIFL